MALGLYNLVEGSNFYYYSYASSKKIDNLSTKLKNIFETCLADDSLLRGKGFPSLQAILHQGKIPLIAKYSVEVCASFQ